MKWTFGYLHAIVLTGAIFLALNNISVIQKAHRTANSTIFPLIESFRVRFVPVGLQRYAESAWRSATPIFSSLQEGNFPSFKRNTDHLGHTVSPPSPQFEDKCACGVGVSVAK